jgi:mono/diheme cytochrome c family protein
MRSVLVSILLMLSVLSAATAVIAKDASSPSREKLKSTSSTQKSKAQKSKPLKSKSQKAALKANEPGLALIKAYQCLDCHTLNGQGAKDGLPLDQLKLPRRLVVDHMLDPEASVERNPFPFNSEPNMMPSHQLSRAEAEAIARYLFEKQPKSPVKKTAKQPPKSNQK